MKQSASGFKASEKSSHSNARKAIRSVLNHKIDKQESMIAKTACTDTSVLADKTTQMKFQNNEESPAFANDCCEALDAISLDEEQFSMAKPIEVLKEIQMACQPKTRSRQVKFMNNMQLAPDYGHEDDCVLQSYSQSPIIVHEKNSQGKIAPIDKPMT